MTGLETSFTAWRERGRNEIFPRRHVTCHGHRNDSLIQLLFEILSD